MVNIYTLRNALSSMSIYSQTQLKEQGVLYPLSKYNKPNTDIGVWVQPLSQEGNQTGYWVTLKSSFKEDTPNFDRWVVLLWKNQWKLYPLLRDIFEFVIKREIIELPYPTSFRFYYTLDTDSGSLSVIAKFK